MQIKCAKCSKILVLPDDKLPKDKDRMVIKCPACGQALAFTIKQNPQTGQENRIQKDDGTVIMDVRHNNYTPCLRSIDDESLYNLLPGDNIIGRAALTDEQGKHYIRITGDPYISGKHCLIRISIQHGIPLCVISDDGSISSSGEPSTNGTFHNGKKITRFDKICLTHGDQIRIGHTEFIFDI